MAASQSDNQEAPHPLVGRTIAIGDGDVLSQDPDDHTENTYDRALSVSKGLLLDNDEFHNHFVGGIVEISMSETFKEMLAAAVEGKLSMSHFAVIAYMAGRLSMALAEQR